MLCYYCNQNEADHRFSIQLMGHTGEIYICSQCLARLGRSLYAAHSPKPEMSGVHPFPIDAGEDVRTRRHLSALRTQLKNAVEIEEYERAAYLRDEIAKTEKGVLLYGP